LQIFRIIRASTRTPIRPTSSCRSGFFIVIACEAAFRNFSDSDYTAIVVIGVCGNKRYIVNVINQHFDVGQMEQAIREQIRQWRARGPIRSVVIETAAPRTPVLNKKGLGNRISLSCLVARDQNHPIPYRHPTPGRDQPTQCTS
jgi:hypothetical protein